MIARSRAVAVRRVATAATLLALVAAGLLATAAPVAAVHAVPWRFTSVSASAFVNFEEVKPFTLHCPDGYTAVSGGVTHVSNVAADVRRLLEYPNPAAGTFNVVVYNGWEGTNVTVSATCVWLDDVGAITTVWGEFARNGSGRAGGLTTCPEGKTILSAGVDWGGTNAGRRIDYSSPADGNGRNWYVAGSSPTSGDTLYVELRCVDASLLGGESVEAADTPDFNPATARCAPGSRVLTGGAAPAGARTPGTYQGAAETSGPVDYRDWKVQGFPPTGVTLRAMAFCVPASTASVNFWQAPAELSNARSGGIGFDATDVAGEQLTVSCTLDGDGMPCMSGLPVNYGPLLDGWHIFWVRLTNQSGFDQSFMHRWKIDATVPTITGHLPTSSASITGSVTITFSEAVTGVTGSSLTVHAETANQNISGTIALPTTSSATWTPNAPLVPGERYRFSFGSAIKDTAGNALTPTFFTIRATTIVESASSALVRRWDVDARTIASGGAHIVSRLAGSRAEHTFTATAGQTVSVYGIKLPDGGKADVYLDGVKVATPSFYASSAIRSRVYLSPALAAGSHTISIRPLGTKVAASTNSWVAVDTVQVGATVIQESALKQTFRRVTTASAYGGSYDTVDGASGTDTTPAQWRLTVVGTGFKVYATKSSGSGKARIYVDGVLKATVNLNGAATAYKALVYQATFAAGSHTIRIEAVGTATGATSAVHLDRITVT